LRQANLTGRSSPAVASFMQQYSSAKPVPRKAGLAPSKRQARSSYAGKSGCGGLDPRFPDRGMLIDPLLSDLVQILALLVDAQHHDLLILRIDGEVLEKLIGRRPFFGEAGPDDLVDIGWQNAVRVILHFAGRHLDPAHIGLGQREMRR